MEKNGLMGKKFEDLTDLQQRIIRAIQKQASDLGEFDATLIKDECGCALQTVYKVKRRYQDLIDGTVVTPLEEELEVEEKELEEEIEDLIEEEELEEEEALEPEIIEAEALMTAEDVGDLSDLILVRIEGWTGYPHWRLTDVEREKWCPQCANMMNKYMPSVMAKYLPEILFTVSTITIFGGKYKDYRTFKKKPVIKEALEEKEELEEEIKEDEKVKEETKGSTDLLKRLP